MGFFNKDIIKKAQGAISNSIDNAAAAVVDKATYYTKTKEGREDLKEGAKDVANGAANVGCFVAENLYKGYKRKVSDYASIANDAYHGRYRDAAGTAADRCKRKAKMVGEIAGEGTTAITSGAKIAYGTVRGTGYDEKEKASLGTSAKKLGMFAAVLLAGAGVAEELGDISLGHAAETHHVDDMFHHDGPHVHTEGVDAIATDHGIIPSFEVNELPGVSHGMLIDESSGTLDQIAHTGEIEGAHHVDDVVRSVEAKTEFLRMNGYASEPEGYQVHHIIPLSEGGADAPNNMILLSEKAHEFITSMHRTFYGWNS